MQTCGLRHVNEMPPGLGGRYFGLIGLEGDPRVDQGGPITSRRDSLSHLGWECPEVLQEGLLGGGPAAIITNPLSGGKQMMDQDERVCLLY